MTNENQSNNSLSYALLTVILIGLIAGLAYQFWPPAKNFFNQIPSQFKTSPKVAQPTPLTEVQTIKTPTAIFFTKADIPFKARAMVQIPFKTDQPHQEIWLVLETKPDSDEVIVLIDHPIFAQLTWGGIHNDHYTLFQKQPTYLSVEEFLKDLPKTGKIVADPHLIYSQKLKLPTSTTALKSDLNFDNYDYFITTYHVPSQQQDFYYSENFVDATNGVLDDKQQLTWSLNMPTISENNKFYLKEIHVDFRQPY